MATTAATPATTGVPAVRRSTGHLLLAGALAGPVFFTSATIQMLTREGFDITRHPISQLSTGDLGWIQITTFVLAGLGALALAGGVRRTLTEGIGRRALPILVGIFGAGMIAAGRVHHGSGERLPGRHPRRAGGSDVLARHRALGRGRRLLHRAGRRRHRARRPIRPPPGRAGGHLNGAAALVLLLPMSPDHMSIQIAVNGLVAFTWTTVLALSLRRSA